MGLIEYLLHDLPKLHAATIAFEDIFTFSDSIGPIMRKLVPSSSSSLPSQLHQNPCKDDDENNGTHDDDDKEKDQIHLVSGEIGTLRLEGLPKRRTLEFHLPSLTHAWRSLAGTEQQQRNPWDSNRRTSHGGGSSNSQSNTHRRRNRLPGQKILSRALEYLHFEANSYDRVPAALRPFFVVAPPPPSPLAPRSTGAEKPDGEIERETAQLHFRSLPDGRERRAGFTIALARELAKVFEDDGGAGSIEWVALDAEPEAPVWRFGLDEPEVQEDGQGGGREDGEGGRETKAGRNEEEMEIWRVSRRDRM